MRAIVQHRYGGADTWGLGERPIPTPGADEVLVRVEAAAIDRGTWHLMTGLPLLARLGLGLRRPRVPVPGRDFAGVITAVGAAVAGLGVGDRVFGTSLVGSLAEFTRARANRTALAPTCLTSQQAAAVPISAVTALQAVRDAGAIGSGQRVLILGAAGGVGSYAVQLAVAAGAVVTGVCSGAKMELVRALGAAEVLDYRRGDPTGPFDVVLDIGGGRPLAQLRRLLAPRGTVVIVGSENGSRLGGGLHRQLGAMLLSPLVKHRLVPLVARENAADLAELARMIDAGAVRPAVDRVFPLAEAAAAMKYLESGQARGKVVVAVAPAG